MYAIFVDGGRQYKVEEGQDVVLDYREATTGDELQFERVLAIATDEGLRLGQPTVQGARITAQVVGVEMGDKLTVQKLRRRKNYRRKTGHRQLFTKVRINRIETA